MSSSQEPEADLLPSPWFTPPQTGTRTAPAPVVDTQTPIFNRMVTEFGDPFSTLGPTRARYAPRTTAA
ncbi:hypothetical protein [Kitasatospora griseola]